MFLLCLSCISAKLLDQKLTSEGFICKTISYIIRISCIHECMHDCTSAFIGSFAITHWSCSAGAIILSGAVPSLNLNASVRDS